MEDLSGDQREQRFGTSLSRRTVLRDLGTAGFATAVAIGAAQRGFAQGTPASTPASTGGTAVAEEYPEVVIVARDFSFEMPSSIEGGFVKLTIDNQGMHDHHAIFLKLNEGLAWADFEPALQDPNFLNLLDYGVSLGGPPSVVGGVTASVIAELPPGQYAVICVIPNEDGTPHYMLGMYAALEVTEPATTRESPSADLTIEMGDFVFHVMDFEGTVAAGSHIWAFPNVGQQLHEAVIHRIAEGLTFENVREILGIAGPSTPTAAATPLATPASGMTPAGPPFVAIGGVAPMSPGFTNWSVLDLTPGEYVIICFVPDPASGAPHFALGMIMPFTVA